MVRECGMHVLNLPSAHSKKQPVSQTSKKLKFFDSIKQSSLPCFFPLHSKTQTPCIWFISQHSPPPLFSDCVDGTLPACSLAEAHKMFVNKEWIWFKLATSFFTRRKMQETLHGQVRGVTRSVPFLLSETKQLLHQCLVSLPTPFHSIPQPFSLPQCFHVLLLSATIQMP